MSHICGCLRQLKYPSSGKNILFGDKVDPRTQSFLKWESLESERRNGVGLKGPMATPIEKGHWSLNLTLLQPSWVRDSIL